ncbi:MAG: ribose 5-phosphate isomerase B [Candidatus Cryptobacteroides sp.]
MMKIGFASDHAGFEYKDKLLALMKKKGFETVDFGTYSSDSCDYPDFAHALGSAIDKGEVDLGIALCGSANGITMTLNKHQGVRAALCWKSEIARLAKAHNNANVLTMPARFISYPMATRIVNTWLSTEYEGGRHQKRIDKIPLR